MLIIKKRPERRKRVKFCYRRVESQIKTSYSIFNCLRRFHLNRSFRMSRVGLILANCRF